MEKSLFSKKIVGLKAPFIAAFLSLFLLILDFQHPEWFLSLRHSVHQLAAKMHPLAQYPIKLKYWLGLQTTSSNQVRQENLALKTQVLQLQVKQQKFADLLAENMRLRGLLNTPLLVDNRLLMAEIIGTDVNPRKHIVILNKGSQDHVFVGQAVMDNAGVLGQVIEVFAKSSKVLLIDDKTHAASVRIERTGMRGIVEGAGDNNQLLLQYVPNTADVQVGDKVVTSGLGASYPAGYIIGHVAKVDRPSSNEFAKIMIKPSASLEGGHYVILLFAQPMSRAPS